MVITSGMEAGGHRASFLNLAEKSLSSTVDLIQKVKANIDIPIIAAGGISTGADIIKVLNQGARAAQLGTVFLATEESNASVEHKSMLLSQKKIETKLTTVFTGRLARVIDTDFVREVDKEGEIAPYPIQSAFLGPLRKAAKESNLLDYEAFWAGQPTSAITHKTTANLFKSLINEIELGGGI
ncbi:MAG: nitronate monooxygenase [Bacteroidota bacterium]